MSTKMSVKYGEDASPITEVGVDESIVMFIVKDDADKEVGRLVIDGYDMPAENRTRVYLYGLNKLLTDRTSDIKDKLAKLDVMQVVHEFLCSGEWAKERTVGAIVCSPEVEALASLGKMSIPDTQAALGQYDKEVRASILGRSDVQLAAKAIRAARKDSAPKTLDDMIPGAEDVKAE